MKSKVKFGSNLPINNVTCGVQVNVEKHILVD